MKCVHTKSTLFNCGQISYIVQKATDLGSSHVPEGTVRVKVSTSSDKCV
jgi:hypothetical protein